MTDAQAISAHDFARQALLKTDLQMLIILLAHVPIVGLLVPWGYGTFTFAVVASLMVGGLALFGYYALRGSRGCSLVFAACLMLFSAIMIQAQMGRIEMHFHIFSALALTIIYRDWLPVVVAAVVIAVHHLILTGLQLTEFQLGGMPIMIFNYGCSWGITFLHAAFVVFEAGILVFFALQMGAERKQALQMIMIVRAFDSEKDLRGRLPEQDQNVSSLSFNQMMEQSVLLIRQLREFSGVLRQNADQLANGSKSTRQYVEDQQQQADQVATATNQMSKLKRQAAKLWKALGL